jgi:hypothetical protein
MSMKKLAVIIATLIPLHASGACADGFDKSTSQTNRADLVTAKVTVISRNIGEPRNIDDLLECERTALSRNFTFSVTRGPDGTMSTCNIVDPTALR